MNALAHIAAQRAREVLKIGDRVQVDHCPSGRITVTMTGWSDTPPDYFTSATHDDLIPGCIVKVNGGPMRFIQPEEEAEWAGRPAVDAMDHKRYREADRFHCGNRHLMEQAALRLIFRNRISDVAAMRFILTAVEKAGPVFAAAFAMDDIDQDVPF